MAVRALTFDFWNTMVVATANGARRRAIRMHELSTVARRHRPGVTSEQVVRASGAAAAWFEDHWQTRHATPRTSDIVQRIWEYLDIEVDAELHGRVVRVFEDSILHGPPHLADGIHEAVAWAAQRFPLAIISDTMISPGRAIRRLLDDEGLLRYFDAFVFSDETGFSKPDVRAFERAAASLGVAQTELLHVGDLRRTDVAGARAAGATAVLFTGIHRDMDETPEPDACLTHWARLPALLSTHMG